MHTLRNVRGTASYKLLVTSARIGNFSDKFTKWLIWIMVLLECFTKRFFQQKQLTVTTATAAPKAMPTTTSDGWWKLSVTLVAHTTSAASISVIWTASFNAEQRRHCLFETETALKAKRAKAILILSASICNFVAFTCIVRDVSEKWSILSPRDVHEPALVSACQEAHCAVPSELRDRSAQKNACSRHEFRNVPQWAPLCRWRWMNGPRRRIGGSRRLGASPLPSKCSLWCIWRFDDRKPSMRYHVLVWLRARVPDGLANVDKVRSQAAESVLGPLKTKKIDFYYSAGSQQPVWAQPAWRGQCGHSLRCGFIFENRSSFLTE